VPVESARVEREPHLRLEHERADVERRPRRSRALQPGCDGGFTRPLEGRRVERRDAVLEEDPVAMGDGDPNVRRAGNLLADLDRVHLTQLFPDRDVAS
jgi:hypothetical protein